MSAPGKGRTVLFVSHNMSAVLNLCNKGVVLRNGLLDYCGNLREAVQLYQNSNMTRSNEWIADKSSPLPQIRHASLNLEEEQPNLTLKIKVKIGSAANNSPAFIAFDIKNGFGTTIMQAIPSITPFLECNGNEKEYRFQVDLIGLIPDSYYVSIWIGPRISEPMTGKRIFCPLKCSSRRRQGGHSRITMITDLSYPIQKSFRGYEESYKEGHRKVRLRSA